MKAFVACAIGHLSDEERETDTEFVRNLLKLLEKIFGPNQTFCAIEQFPDPEQYPPPSKALGICVQAIVQTKFFFLYYPRKVCSGALVELGHAQAYGKPTLIFTQNKSVLPYILQDESELTGICQLESRAFDEFVPDITAFVMQWL